MVKPVVCSKLIYEASRILEHQKEISTLKGENFNIFSILKMESKENATHSAFLGELLDPNGSHNMGDLFLRLFLETVAVEHLDIKSANLKLEYYLGERNDVEKTGGRVDIFIADKDFKTVCIENKIDAPDQNVQIERYCNFNQNKNKVFYLTLDGKDPNPESCGNLVAGDNFLNISYSSDIVEWLEKCAKEAINQPILRETIQQYIILIKKLTDQLTDIKMENEIQKLIIQNYEAAKIIEASIAKVELNYATKLLMGIELTLEKKFDDRWIIEVDKNLEKTWTGLKIRHKDWPEKVSVKLEGQSKIPWSDSIYGIIGNKNNCNRKILNFELSNVMILEEGFKNNDVWPFFKPLLYFGDTKGKLALFDDGERSELVNYISQKLYDLSKACEEPLKKVHKINQVEGSEVSLN